VLINDTHLVAHDARFADPFVGGHGTEGIEFSLVALAIEIETHNASRAGSRHPGPWKKEDRQRQGCMIDEAAKIAVEMRWTAGSLGVYSNLRAIAAAVSGS
jgi:hypothetical protein